MAPLPSPTTCQEKVPFAILKVGKIHPHHLFNLYKHMARVQFIKCSGDPHENAYR
jgi:hypothetical protein